MSIKSWIELRDRNQSEMDNFGRRQDQTIRPPGSL